MVTRRLLNRFVLIIKKKQIFVLSFSPYNLFYICLIWARPPMCIFTTDHNIRKSGTHSGLLPTLTYVKICINLTHMAICYKYKAIELDILSRHRQKACDLFYITRKKGLFLQLCCIGDQICCCVELYSFMIVCRNIVLGLEIMKCFWKKNI